MALVNRQPHIYVYLDTHDNIPFLTVGSPVAVQYEDAGSWTHDTVVGQGSDYHYGRNY